MSSARRLIELLTFRFFKSFGRDNAFQAETARSLSGRMIVKRGSDNRVTLGPNSEFAGVLTIEGSGNSVVIGENAQFGGRIMVKGNGQTVSIGANSTLPDTYILCQENQNVSIGRWCMFSRDIEIRTTDAHSMIDRQSGKRLNPPGSVAIGDHVWIGVGTLVSKGASIPDDTIIGAKSFVSGTFEASHTVLAGVPARVIRSDVTWHRQRRGHFKDEQRTYWLDDDGSGAGPDAEDVNKRKAS